MGTIRVRALLPTPLPRVCDFVVDPRNQPLWVPNIESVAGVDRPLQTGDRLTQWRRDFLRLQKEEHLVEEVVPYRFFRLRVLTHDGGRMQGTATLSVEEGADTATTWIEEALSYSIGEGPLARWVERWLLDPVLCVVVRRACNRAFRRLAERL